MITSEEFIFKIITQDYDGVKKAIEEGFDVNTQVPEKVAIVESAQPAEDYEMLYILWKSGARATTPWLGKVFASFEIGHFPQNEKKEVPQNIKKFNSNNFSMKKLKISNGKLFLSENDCRIELQIHPFELDDEVIATCIYLEDMSLPVDIKDIENKNFDFPAYPQEGCIDSSIYLKNVHNPITVKTISFKKYDKSSDVIKVSLDMEFDFETIDIKNEEVKINTVISVSY